MTDTKQNLAEFARKKRYLHLVEKLHGGKPLTKQEIAELEQFEAEPLGDTVVKTMEEVARVMEVTYRTVQRWKKEGMPVTEQGLYDLRTIYAWRDRRNSTGEEKEGKAYWDEKVQKYRATLLEIELKKTQGELLPRKEVEKGRIARILAVKRAFLALPTRLAPVLAMKEPREIEAIIYEEICEIIDDFAGVRHDGKEKKTKYMDAEGEGSVEAAGENRGEPLG
ncbi:MAG: hypothetical protein ABIH47_09225 [Candidatus Omnitrophota bacterium]